MSRLKLIGTQLFDDNGDPLSGGLLYFYEEGTSTPFTTYSDEGETTANANPVVLDAAGRVPDIFFTGQAKLVIKDADDVQIDLYDPVGDVGVAAGGGYWNFIFPAKTDDFTAVAGDFYFADTAAGDGSLTMTLPLSPSVGDRVGLRWVDDGESDSLTIARNGENIEAAASDLSLNDSSTYPGAILIYESAARGWVMMQNMAYS